MTRVAQTGVSHTNGQHPMRSPSEASETRVQKSRLATEGVNEFRDNGTRTDLVGYARISTTDQVLDLQLDALRAAGCVRCFSDTASGSTTDRPDLTRALDYVRPGDTLVVWKLDRLGRSLPHLIETVQALEERGIGFKSLQEALDTTTPGGRLIFHVIGAMAQFERDLIRERTHAGLAAARARGRVGGRPRVLTPEKLKAAQQLRAAGELNVSEIAKTLSVSRASVYRALADVSADREETVAEPRVSTS